MVNVVNLITMKIGSLYFNRPVKIIKNYLIALIDFITSMNTMAFVVVIHSIIIRVEGQGYRINFAAAMNIFDFYFCQFVCRINRPYVYA